MTVSKSSTKDDKLRPIPAIDSLANTESLVWPVYLQAHTVTVRPVVVGGSSARVRLPSPLQMQLTSLLNKAKGEEFEFGINSNLSEALVEVIQISDAAAINGLQELVLLGKCKESVGAEVLRTLGAMLHPSTYSDRQKFLEFALFNKSPIIRQAAALGLAYMDDPASIPTVETAAEREQTVWLRKYIVKVLEQLRQTSNANPS